MPQVTVIIPAYNARSTVRSTLESVLAQTFADFEAIVIDDGSTDETAQVVARMLDQRVKLVSQANAGVSPARIVVELAKVEFVAFLDADDRWLPRS